MVTKTNPRMVYEGIKKYGEEFGGKLLSDTQTVQPYVLYENRINGHDKFGSFVLIDAADYPDPIEYRLTNGGSIMNGVLGLTERTGGTGKTLIGYRAGENTVGNDNVFVGIQAGEDSNSDSATFDKGNAIGIGRLALHDFTGYATIGIGAEAGNHATSNQSVFMGSYSGNSCVVNGISAIGYRSAENNTGANSTFMGRHAGKDNKGGTATAFGYGSMEANEGHQNVAVGAYIMGSAAAGADFNVAVGQRNFSSITGSRNTSLGYQAGYTAAGWDWDNCTLIGYQAGLNSTNHGNTVVGRSAGVALTGQYNTVLGYAAGSNHAYSYTTVIGQAATVTGNSQVQLGGTGTTTYAYGAVQDRSDMRDKVDIKALTDAHIAFFMDVEWRQYRMDYREDYREVDAESGIYTEVVKDGSRSGKRYHIGAVAQQVEAAMKKHGIDFAGLQHHAVNGGDDVYTIGYQEFIGIQGEIIQRQQKDIAAIKEHLGL